MIFDEAMTFLRQRKIVTREGRTLRLLAVGFFDPVRKRPTEITDEDRAATDWELIEQQFVEPEVVAPEVVAPEVVDEVLHENALDDEVPDEVPETLGALDTEPPQ